MNCARKWNVLEYLEQTESLHGDAPAVDGGQEALSWRQLGDMARRVGTAVSKRTSPGSPVPVLMEKSPAALAIMLGIVYAGCFYVPVNPANPPERIRKLMEKLSPELVVTDQGRKTGESQPAGEEAWKGTVCSFGELTQEPADRCRLEEIRKKSTPNDILYGIFTSGSTGTPKAILVSHDAVIRFIGHFTRLFGFTCEDCIGNQAPFDFDVSVKDIYSAIFTGARLVLIPKEYFSTPPRLLDYLCEKEVTSLTWAVSALTLVTALKGLDYKTPEKVRRVLFSGEAMPPKQLRIWQEHLPEARFVNLYGPTEITCNCTWYPVERLFQDGEKIPAGKPFPGRRVFLLDEKGQEQKEPFRTGEICVAGESLSEGYYRDEAQTREHFIWYPLDEGEPQRAYRTGDLGYFDEDGNLVFAGRKDFQIKHMGHRIELEEIERAMVSLAGVSRSCCVFLPERNKIFGFYVGDLKPEELRSRMKERLPVYMIPSRLVQAEEMPLNKNGKTDRDYLRRLAENGGKAGQRNGS